MKEKVNKLINVIKKDGIIKASKKILAGMFHYIKDRNIWQNICLIIKP